MMSVGRIWESRGIEDSLCILLCDGLWMGVMGYGLGYGLYWRMQACFFFCDLIKFALCISRFCSVL